jgi:integrase
MFTGMEEGMGEIQKSYRLWCRKDRGGNFYVKLPGENWRSTNSTDRSAAEKHANDLVAAKRIAELTGQQLPNDKLPGKASIPLGEYAINFFKWEPEKRPACPHCLRVLSSGGQIGPEHVKRQRRLLERFILGDDENENDPIALIPIIKIRRGDCIDFRDRMVMRLEVDISNRDIEVGKRLVNGAMTVLSTIFTEAVEREDLDANPAVRLHIRYKKKKRDIFSADELRKLFPIDLEDYGPWDDLRTKTAYLLAAVCGLRRNEIRAIKWSNVGFENQSIKIVEAFKGESRIGLPKWDKTRQTALPGVAARHLKAHRAKTKYSGDSDFVFANVDGTPLGTQAWKNMWHRAMKKAEMNLADRNLVPHSLRHGIATELRAAGISEVLLKKGLGWTADEMLEHYSDHMGVEQFRKQAEAVDSLFKY